MYALIELTVIAVTAAILITQVIVPLFYGTVVFPYFRVRKLAEKLEHAKEDVEIAEVERLIDILNEEATAIKEKSQK